ncbi:hypothetical protein [Pseudonocardia sp. GCM10023141]|uniref:hypothetical protein n=1 Tax=Pseudonocardia sp. GCM10023141 TaxID=3252653 RepID=UPI00360B1F51
MTPPPGRSIAALALAAVTLVAACARPAVAPLPDAPAHPQVGVSYRFDLYTHCGFLTAVFDGRHWRAGATHSVDGLPIAGNPTWRFGSTTPGVMTLAAADELHFVLDAPGPGGVKAVDFVPVDPTAPAALCP